MGISSWLDGFTEFQRNRRSGPELVDRVAELRKKADLIKKSIFSLVVINTYNERNLSTIFRR